MITIIGRFPNQLPPQTHTALQPHANLPAGLSEIIVEALQLFYLSHKLVTFLELPGDPVAHPHTREEEKKITNACKHNANTSTCHPSTRDGRLTGVMVITHSDNRTKAIFTFGGYHNIFAQAGYTY